MLFPSKIISKYIMSMLSRLLFLGLPKLEVNKANQGSNSSALEKKTCLIIRLDGIGDYVLFRNYIEKIKDSKKYKGYSVSLLCDEALKGFADKLDGEYLDEIIWFNRKKFFKKPLYGLNFLHKLSGLKFHTIISPVYTRNYFFTDTFVRLINAKEQIGSTGDEIDISLGQKNISNGWYTSLVSATSGTMFEFYRNKEFFENLIGEEITLPRPKIALPAKKSSFVKEIEKEMKNKYFAVLFIGGSDDLRRWSKKNLLNWENI